MSEERYAAERGFGNSLRSVVMKRTIWSIGTLGLALSVGIGVGFHHNALALLVPVSLWSGEENAYDSVDGNDGILFGGSYMEGKVGRAFSLDGGGYVDIGNKENLNFGTGDFTVTFWVKTDQAPTDNDQKVFVNKQTSHTSEVRTGFEVILASPYFEPQVQGTVVFVIRDGVYGAGIASLDTVNDGRWHSVAAVKTAGYLSLCIDGVFQGVKPHQVTGSISTATSFRIGELSDRETGSHEFIGGLDEITVYNQALTPGELQCRGESTVDIDIKPGSSPNSINTGNQGTIPVAIFSTSTFSAPNDVDVNTLRFGYTGFETSLALCNVNGEDVDGDGVLDLVCHFNTVQTDFQKGDTLGYLTGTTTAGFPLFGVDSVRIVR